MNAVALWLGWMVIVGAASASIGLALAYIDHRRERAAAELRHRWGRDCAGEWEEVVDLTIRCTACRARHVILTIEAMDAWRREQVLVLALREATASGTLDLWRERAA